MRTGGLRSWAPGAVPRLLPDGIDKFLRKGSELVLQIHYHPDGKPETDQLRHKPGRQVSAKAIDAMPDAMRDRVRQAIQNRLAGADD